MYAEVDGWEFNGEVKDPSESLHNPLDQWIVSRVHQLTREVEKHMDGYDLPNAMKPILPFIEDASNWYVRRSRRRFWKSGDTDDKNTAYGTLHYVLVRLSMVLAPFTPFLAEELYQKLTGGESVHLLDWPVAGHVNQLVIDEMTALRGYVNEGLSLRAQGKMKVRQPLASITVPRLGEFVDYAEILRDELNVKEVIVGDNLALDLELTPALRREGLMREVVRHVQGARKAAGLQVDDRIVLALTTQDTALLDAVEIHRDEIMAEVLATALTQDKAYEYVTPVKVEGMDLSVSLQKA